MGSEMTLMLNVVMVARGLLGITSQDVARGWLDWSSTEYLLRVQSDRLIPDALIRCLQDAEIRGAPGSLPFLLTNPLFESRACEIPVAY